MSMLSRGAEPLPNPYTPIRQGSAWDPADSSMRAHDAPLHGASGRSPVRCPLTV
jgi:hypothetical protein